MQLRADQLAAPPAAACAPLYTVRGDEPLLAQEAATRSAPRRAPPAAPSARCYTVAGAHFDWSELLGASQALSLFADAPADRDPHPVRQAGQGRLARRCSATASA